MAPAAEVDVLAPDGLRHHRRADGTADDARAELHGQVQGSAGFEPGVTGQASSLDGAAGWIDTGEDRKVVEWKASTSIARSTRWRSTTGP